MATGTEFLLDALLKMAGVDPATTKDQIVQFAQKFVEQDALLHRIEAQNDAIMRHFKIGDYDGSRGSALFDKPFDIIRFNGGS
jgi:hypothetical protein